MKAIDLFAGVWLTDSGYKNGVPLQCMNKKEAQVYMASQGTDQQTLEHILSFDFRDLPCFIGFTYWKLL